MESRISYTEIYNSYSPKIRRYLNSIFSIEDSEDLLQDVFLKIFNGLPSFRGEANINTWIYRIVSNTVIDRLKSNAHKFNKAQHELNPSNFHYNNSIYVSTFDKQIEKEEMNDCIRQFINELTEKNRTVFALSQYENLTNKEIAEILNITIDSVKIRLHRAKENLKDSLIRNCNVYFDECSELSCEPISTHKN
jgi:RNA polymerase sigma-70 factor (ECF subfamily)